MARSSLNLLALALVLACGISRGESGVDETQGDDDPGAGEGAGTSMTTSGAFESGAFESGGAEESGAEESGVEESGAEESGVEETGEPENDWACGDGMRCEQRVMTLGESTDDGMVPGEILDQIVDRSFSLRWLIDGYDSMILKVVPIRVGDAEIVERYGRDCDQAYNFIMGYCEGGFRYHGDMSVVSTDISVEGEGFLSVTVDVPGVPGRGDYMVEMAIWWESLKGELPRTVTLDGVEHTIDALYIRCYGLSTDPDADDPSCWISNQAGIDLAGPE